MSKRPITLENILDRRLEPYSSILNLMVEFQNHKDGLNFEHLRYVLVKDHGIINNNAYARVWARKMAEFFGGRLHDLFKSGRVKPGQISSKNNLNITYLKTLKRLECINKDDETGKYRTKDKIHNELIRLNNTHTLNKYEPALIMSLPEVKAHKKKERKHILYGISQSLFNSLDISQQDEINNHIKLIDNHLKKIEYIKGSGLEKIWSEKIRQICNKIENKDLERVLLENRTEFLELMNVIRQFFDWKTPPNRNANSLSEVWKYWNILEKYIPFAKEEIMEVIDIGIIESNEILYDFNQKEISYSAYNRKICWEESLGPDTVAVDIFDVFASDKSEKYGSGKSSGSFFGDLYGEEIVKNGIFKVKFFSHL